MFLAAEPDEGKSFASRGAFPGSDKGVGSSWNSRTSTSSWNVTLFFDFWEAAISLVNELSCKFCRCSSISPSSFSLSAGRFWMASIAGSFRSREMMLRDGRASPFGIAVIDDKNGDPLIITYRPRDTLISNSLFTISKDSVE